MPAAWCYARRKLNGWTDDQAAETLDAERLAKRAIECGNDDAVALASSGIAIGYMFDDFERAVSLMDRKIFRRKLRRTSRPQWR